MRTSSRTVSVFGENSNIWIYVTATLNEVIHNLLQQRGSDLYQILEIIERIKGRIAIL